MSSVASKLLLKSAMDTFMNNGHSCECSYLIVKYFIGLKDTNILNYRTQIKKAKNCANNKSNIKFIQQ